MTCGCLPSPQHILSSWKHSRKPQPRPPDDRLESTTLENLNVVLPSTAKPTTTTGGSARSSDKSLGNPSISVASSSQPQSSTKTIVDSEHEENGKEPRDRPTLPAGIPQPQSSARTIGANIDNESCMRFLDDPTRLVGGPPKSSPTITAAEIVHHTHDIQKCLDDPSLVISKFAPQSPAKEIFTSELREGNTLGDSSHSAAASLQAAKASVVSFGAADEWPQVLYPPSGNHERLDVPDKPYQDYHSSVHYGSDISHDLSADDSMSILEEKLSDARLEWPPEGNQYFIPRDKLEELITVNSIEDELKERHIHFAHSEARRQSAKRILKTAPKLFAILVLIQRTQFIGSFLDEGLDDSHLPFIRSDKNLTGGNFKLCSGLHPNQPIACIDGWSKARIRELARVQWCVLAPIFEQSEEALHYTLDGNCVLPFLEQSKSCEEGGFSTVYEIIIHPAHQFIHYSSDPKVKYPSIAMKRLHTTHKEDFDSEVKMLKAIRRHRHPHLVKLLATFQWRSEYYLLFPYAKANLRKYWEQTPLPEFSPNKVLWILNQCKGIASGLLRIHGYRDTLEYTLSAEQSPTRLTRAKTGIIDGRLYGRHGDIKPENILWTDEHLIDEHQGVCKEGCLLIADFGLMDSHRAVTRSKVRPNIAGTPAYEPPEPELQSNISRAYDIWSLGRVYLEFITWLLGGKKELDRWSGVCGMNGINENDGDKFYTIIHDNLNGHRRRATVRDGVKEWIEDIHRKPQCSDLIHEFLELIVGEMLVVDPHERIHCGNLSERFSKMLCKAEENPNYLTEGKPRPPRTIVERTEQNSVATSGSDQEISSPSSKVGDPKPKSSTTANGSATEAPQRPQIVSSATFFSESPPSSPSLVKGHNQEWWER